MTLYDLRPIAGKGTGLLASQNISTGTLILTEEPYAAVLSHDRTYSRSNFNFQPSPALMPCAGCGYVRYTSPAELKADWDCGHKMECKALKASACSLPSSDELLAARILWRRCREEESENALHGQDYSNVARLVDHMQSQNPDQQEAHRKSAKNVKKFMALAGTPGSDIPMNEVAGVLAKIQMNAFGIQDLGDRFGNGLYTIGGLINHSCRPNACQTYQGKTLRVIATRDIKAGEEICITYCPTVASKLERRTQLLQDYRMDIFSAEDQRYVATTEPYEQQWVLDDQAVRIIVWPRSPCHLDAMDQQLVGLTRQSSGDKILPDCGLVVREKILKGEANEDDEDESVELLVDLWGAGLRESDGKFDQRLLRKLIDHVLACFVFINIYDKVKQVPIVPFEGVEFNWHNLKKVQETEKELKRCKDPILLGEFHTLHQQATEIKGILAMEEGKAAEAYKLIKQTHNHKRFMKLTSPVEVIGTGFFLANFAQQQGQLEEAIKFAEETVENAKILYPHSPEVENCVELIQRSKAQRSRKK